MSDDDKKPVWPRMIEARLQAWITSTEAGVPISQYSLQRIMKGGVTAVEALSFYRDGDLPPDESLIKGGWHHVGVATIRIELHDEQAMCARAVESLRAQRQAAIAKHQAWLTNVDRQINQLLQIGFDQTVGSAVEVPDDDLPF